MIFSAALSTIQAAQQAPGKNVIVVNKEALDPLWKQWWDEARELTKQHKYLDAVDRYRAVLEEKPLIEEVKWELFKIYIVLADYDQALPLIESLLEAAPDSIDYLLSAGRVALLQDRAEQATRNFGQALELDPGGPLSEQALRGLVRALVAQDKHFLAIPLMEQLYQRGVAGPDILTDLARIHRQYDDLQKSGYYFSELVKKYRVETEVVREAADVLERTGKLEEAAGQWLAYLETYPDYLPYQKKLADYYYDQGRQQEALPHMLKLVDYEVERETYLLEVARIYLYSLGRSDRALFYFEQYRNEFPDGVDVSFEIENIHLILANDLLAIVENDGVWMLWRDLAMITPDRIGIYRAMAKMLEEMGRDKEDELLEVLQIINVHEPDDLEVVTRIAQLYLGSLKINECLAFLEQVRGQNETQPGYYLLRALCQQAAGDDFGELRSYMDYLAIAPEDVKVRGQAIKLAGELGLVEQMQHLYSASPGATARTTESTDQVASKDLAFFKGLLANSLSRAAASIYHELLDEDGMRRWPAEMTGSLAALFAAQGRNYQAEQILRTYGARYPDNIESYLMLVDHSLRRGNRQAAQAWLKGLDRLVDASADSLSSADTSRIFHQKLRYEALSSEKTSPFKGLEYLNQRMKSDEIIAEDLDIVLLVAGNYYRSGRYQELLDMLQRFRQKFKGVDDFTSMLFLALVRVEEEKPDSGEDRFSTLSFSEQLAVGRRLLALGDYTQALSYLKTLVEKVPDSVSAQVILADTEAALLNYRNASEVFSRLGSTFEEEPYFQEQVLKLENLQGKPTSLLAAFAIERDAATQVPRIISRNAALDYAEVQLIWARALWSDNRWDEALEAYRLIGDGMRREMSDLVEKLALSPGFDELLKASSAGSFFSAPDDQEILDFFMSPSFIAENFKTEIAEITSTSYDHYRWLKIVDREIAAKEALAAKEFYQAEISYQTLIKEENDMAEEAVSVYPELATVYSRLGKFEKQTEILEKIKEKKIIYPDLQETAEINIRQQQPHLSLDMSYREEDGRNGYKDITEQFIGFGLQIKPAIFQEAGVQAGRSEYGNSSGSTFLKSNYILGKYALQFNDNLEADLNLGFEDFDTDGKSFLLYDFSIRGTLEKRLDLFAKVTQVPVDDTIESLAEGIYQRNLQAGITLDYLFGLFFGFDMSVIDYSDLNEGNEYHLWSSYRWFGERSSLDFTYSYLNLQNEITNTEMSFDPATALTDAPYQLPYWSPGEYWKHSLTALYRLELWPTGRLQRGTGSISFLYGLGYEQGDYFVHDLGIDILLEITQSFLVKGSFSTLISDDYKDLEAFASLVYRW